MELALRLVKFKKIKKPPLNIIYWFIWLIFISLNTCDAVHVKHYWMLIINGIGIIMFSLFIKLEMVAWLDNKAFRGPPDYTEYGLLIIYIIATLGLIFLK